MISQKYTRQFMNEHRPIAPGAVIPDEGMALVFERTATETCVKPSTGAAGEVFAGFSWAHNTVPSFLPMVVQGKIGATGTLELPRLPIAGELLFKVAGQPLEIVANAPADATQARLVGEVLTVSAENVGKTFIAQFLYEPSVVEARQILGDMPIGGLNTTAMSVIGVVTRADLATSYFDASADFTSGFHPSLGTDGRLTMGGTGTKLENVTIVSAPSADNPFLVVRANV